MVRRLKRYKKIDIHHPDMVKTVFILSSIAILAFLVLIVKTTSFKKSSPQAAANQVAFYNCNSFYYIPGDPTQPYYDSSKDFCDSFVKSCDKKLGQYIDKDGEKCSYTSFSKCCRNTELKFFGQSTNYWGINTGFCRRKVSDQNSICESSCTSGRKDLGVKCKVKNETLGWLLDGKCCGALKPSTIPSPTAVPKSDRDCGINHIDCLASFGQAPSGYNNSSQNYQNASNFPVRCTKWTGSNEYGCYFIVGGTQCDGMQFANPVIQFNGNKLDNTCLVGVRETSHGFEGDTNFSNGYFCSTRLYSLVSGGAGFLENCKSKMGRGW